MLLVMPTWINDHRISKMAIKAVILNFCFIATPHKPIVISCQSEIHAWSVSIWFHHLTECMWLNWYLCSTTSGGCYIIYGGESRTSSLLFPNFLKDFRTENKILYVLLYFNSQFTETAVRVVMIFAEGIFEGESHVVWVIYCLYSGLHFWPFLCFVGFRFHVGEFRWILNMQFLHYSDLILSAINGK